MRKTKMTQNEMNIDKLRQDNLNLQTKLEIITYDLAEFDEISLETQMLREGMYRRDKKLEALQEDIKVLRAREAEMETVLAETKQHYVDEIERVHSEALLDDQNEISEKMKQTIANLKDKIVDLEEKYVISRDEISHAGEMLASSMSDLAKQRLEYEELAEKSTLIMRENEELMSQVRAEQVSEKREPCCDDRREELRPWVSQPPQPQ